MKKHLLKSMLVMAMMAFGANAWAGEKTVVKYSFDDAMSPALTAGSRVSFDYDKTSVITSTKFLNAWNNANGDPGSSTVSLGSTDLSGETWTLSFEWAACGGCNSKADHTTLKAGDTNLFDLTGNSNWNTTVTITYTGSDGTKTLPVPGCDKNKRFKADVGDQLNTTAYWHHIVVTGSASGVKMTITNSSTGTAVVEDVVLSETNVNPTSLIIEPCCGGGIGIDELLLTYYVEGEVIQTPIAAYTKVDGIKRVITATCDTEGATIQYSLDGESWTDGAEVTVAESGKVYFKAVKGTSESDVLTFDAVAGEEIVLNTPLINRTSDTSVTITADQSKLLLSPNATIYYTYGEENGSFVGSKTLTVKADATITAYAEFEGYKTSEVAERAVALFPTIGVNLLENTTAKTSGWSASAFSAETVTVSERTYAALLLDDAQWGQNIYLQTNGAWGLRASGNWYINSDTEESWMLMKDLKKGDLVVVDITYPASAMVNASYSKYAFGTKHAYEVTKDGDVELAFKKIDAQTMDYFYGVAIYHIKQPIYIETDVTAQFPVDYQGWTGATGFVGWAAPQITTNDGRTTAACEKYETTCENTGDVFYRTLTGLTNGTYRIELYGAAAYTSGRGFESALVEGDETAVYLYAETPAGIVKQYIPAHVATDFNGTGIATATLEGVVVTDGTVKVGMSKDKAYTNWHVIQIKGVTAQVNAIELYAASKAKADAINGANMNANVQAALTAAIVDDTNFTTADEYKKAIADLDEAVKNAEASAAIYKTVADLLNKTLDEEGASIFNADETVVKVKEAFEAKTLETLSDADNKAIVEVLVKAEKAQITDGSILNDVVLNAAWTCDQGNGPGVYAVDCTETYNTAANKAGKVIYQKIEGLQPGGVYEATFLGVANMAWIGAATGNGIAQLFASNADPIDIEVIGQTACTPADYERTITGTVGEDGVLEYGIQNIAEGGNWYVARALTLTLKTIGKVPTGISEVNTTAEAANAIYNLAGQKVQKAQKGLFIINGKKVVK